MEWKSFYPLPYNSMTEGYLIWVPDLYLSLLLLMKFTYLTTAIANKKGGKASMSTFMKQPAAGAQFPMSPLISSTIHKLRTKEKTPTKKIPLRYHRHKANIQYRRPSHVDMQSTLSAGFMRSGRRHISSISWVPHLAPGSWQRGVLLVQPYLFFFAHLSSEVQRWCRMLTFGLRKGILPV
jgi:hypothetical protein